MDELKASGKITSECKLSGTGVKGVMVLKFGAPRYRRWTFLGLSLMSLVLAVGVLWGFRN